MYKRQVYAVCVSRPLKKALRLDIQHCVDLSRPDLSKYLKFAIAPVDTPSLPYQFSAVEGGEFPVGTWYGSINRKEFCLVGIVGEVQKDEFEEEEQPVEEEPSTSDSESDKTSDPPSNSSQGQ